jgi:fermentation-respiration switch protein FrsA (DUF1100 family)
MKRKKLFIATAILLAFGFSAFAGVSYFFALLFIAPARCVIGSAPGDFPFPIKDVSFQTADRLTLKGWYSPAADNKSAIILLHGHEGNRWQMYETAKMLRRAGYGVLLYDARAMGESDGEATSIGYYETEDLTAAVQFLRGQGVERLACLGQSQGGATILLAAAKLDGVRCVIAQSSYDTLLNAIDRRYREYFHIPGWLGGALLVFFAERKLGVDAETISPLQEVKNLRCPLLIISGTADTRTLTADTQKLFAAAPSPKVVEGGGHEDLYAARPQDYERRVLDFLSKYLHP